ncbi:protein kinase [Oleiphilus sp. HI0125]|uniref:AarF/UbiB family protein n=2 Tax=Oleiphilus sp. HI0125 TaxID=1822266 RepID=UPI0007C23A7D|nr:AarF/UbiB family protein [Oleiphilus sp. HI0125]KZZ58009.1 protein kinase [Oleiphilus sp. HI0125]
MKDYDNDTNELSALTDSLKSISNSTWSFLKRSGSIATSSLALPTLFSPVLKLVISDEDVSRSQLAETLDGLFDGLYAHPVSNYSKDVTAYLRKSSFIPNEESTERLIKYLVSQSISRSPVEIPEVVIEEFWLFFQELIESPELQGIFELNLEITRAIIRVYEPLLVEAINTIKHLRKINRDGFNEIVRKLQVLRGDIQILKRQIQAIRYIKPFLETDPKDFHAQAQIVSKMVSEFGPLFIKMAQVAAASADFLPEEISRELAVFQQDVEPMSVEQVRKVFFEDFGQPPESMYYEFDASKPLKSGSIGSVFLAKKAVENTNSEGETSTVLVPIVVKVARHNLEREFAMGSLAIELMLISSQYWAPHSKLKPFLKSMAEQIKEFTRGFEQELDFSLEAETQRRFYERALGSDYWSVPKVYGASGRVIEMEYVSEVSPISQVLESWGQSHEGDVSQFRRRVAHNFIYTVVEQFALYQEIHGDLHPGNVLADERAHLYLIDWGNSVQMRGKWGYVYSYLTSALCGDVDALTDTLIAMSTNPAKHESQRADIHKALLETMSKKGIQPIEIWNVRQFMHEGADGLNMRVSAALQLLSNTYQLGMTIQSDYLHLTRSISALVASYANLYAQEKKVMVAKDLLTGFATVPLKYGILNIVEDVSSYAWNRFKEIPVRIPKVSMELVPLNSTPTESQEAVSGPNESDH